MCIRDRFIPGPADNRFRLSTHCANEPQRQAWMMLPITFRCCNLTCRIRLRVVWSCIHAVRCLPKAVTVVLQSSCSSDSTCERPVSRSRMVLAWRSCGKLIHRYIDLVVLNTPSDGHSYAFSALAVLSSKFINYSIYSLFIFYFYSIYLVDIAADWFTLSPFQFFLVFCYHYFFPL